MLAMFPLFSGIPSWNLKERGDLTDVGEIPWQFAEALMVQPFSSPHYCGTQLSTSTNTQVCVHD